MPRIRTIKPKFWDDTKLSKVSRDARLLFIGMWNFCDDLGVLIGDHTWIKSKIFPYDKLNENEFGNFLNELIEGKFVMCINSNKEEYIYIPKFNKHQRINKPNNDDIYIDYKELMTIVHQSNTNHVLITEQGNINHVSSAGGKDRIVEDRKGKEDVFSEEKFIVPEMQKIWKKNKPEYPEDISKDFSAIREISEFISNQAGITYPIKNKDDTNSVLKLWEVISKFVSEHSFFKNYSLYQVEKHIQNITQAIKNGESSIKNGKSIVGKINGQQLNEAFTKFYSSAQSS